MHNFNRIISEIITRIKNIFGSRLLKRIAPLALIAFIAIITFVTCESWEPPPEPEPEPEPPLIIITPPPAPPPEPEPPEPEPEEYCEEPEPEWEGPWHPLTGLPTEEDISHLRPFAIVIDNLRAALPQRGMSQADIIYEVLVEGGITRMLAIFQNPTEASVIGAVRSARLYTVDIAQSYDAIFVFSGGSPQANAAIRNRGITHIVDGGGRGARIFFRDRNRRAPHNLMTSGEFISRHLADLNLRLEHEEGYVRALNFIEDGTPENGEPATDFSVMFGPNSKTTTFIFNEETGLYYLRQYGSPYNDGNNNQQIAVTNVLILRMATSGVPGDTEGRLAITTTGTGTGYFVNGGYVIPINWSRENNSSQFIYTTEDGEPLELGRGRTYVCIIRSTMNVEFN